MDLIVKLLAVNGGAAPTSARWVTALDHEILDDPVKLGAVVISTVGELGKVPARSWSVLPVHLQRDVAHTATDSFVKSNMSCFLECKNATIYASQASLTYVVSRMTKGGCQDFSGTDMMPQFSTNLW